MFFYSDLKLFEKANKIKKIIYLIENNSFFSQKIQFHDFVSRDFFSYIIKDNYISFCLLIYREGKLINFINKITYKIEKIIIQSEQFLSDFYFRNISPKYLISDVDFSNSIFIKLYKIKFMKNWNKHKKIINIAKINSSDFLRRTINKKVSIFDNLDKPLRKLKKLCNLKSVTSIEAYDNSHFNGDNYVSAAIVFSNGYPDKKLYRKYNINLKKANDAAAFKELIIRRFKTFPKIIPDLIIVDGGIIQVNIVKKTLIEVGLINVKVLGLIKDKHHRTKCLLFNNEYIYLKNDDSLFLFLSKIQEEIHRFVINFFRDELEKMNNWTKIYKRSYHQLKN